MPAAGYTIRPPAVAGTFYPAAPRELAETVTLFAAEVNTVRVMKLWPRGLVADRPTEADERVLKGLAETEERKTDEAEGKGERHNEHAAG